MSKYSSKKSLTTNEILSYPTDVELPAGAAIGTIALVEAINRFYIKYGTTEWRQLVENRAYAGPVSYTLARGPINGLVTESDTMTVYITASNVPNGTSVNYSWSGIDADDIEPTDSLTGSAVIIEGAASVTVTLADDLTTEGEETAVFTLNATDSVGNFTESPQISFTIEDTSIDPIPYALSPMQGTGSELFSGAVQPYGDYLLTGRVGSIFSTLQASTAPLTENIYIEIIVNQPAIYAGFLGFASKLTSSYSATDNTNGLIYFTGNHYRTDGAFGPTGLAGWEDGDVLQFGIDISTRTFYYSKNNDAIVYSSTLSVGTGDLYFTIGSGASGGSIVDYVVRSADNQTYKASFESKTGVEFALPAVWSNSKPVTFKKNGNTVNEANEGDTVTVHIYSTATATGTVNYTLSGISSADINDASLTGSVSLTNYEASFDIVITNDVTTGEGEETLTVSFVDNGTTYTANLTINDSSAIPVGQALFTSVGIRTWVCPEGVTSVSVVTIGGGGAGYDNPSSPTTLWAAGGGGALGYKNNIPVVPGQSYTVQVGAGALYGNSDLNIGTNDAYGAEQGSGGRSLFINASTVSATGGRRSQTRATFVGDLGGQGGLSGYSYPNQYAALGGGGAGGYAGNGGNGGSDSNAGVRKINGTAGSGGGGGGGASDMVSTSWAGDFYAGGGGGVGVYGLGASGAGGTHPGSATRDLALTAGKGGSAGDDGHDVNGDAPRGGLYGGGGGIEYRKSSTGTDATNFALNKTWMRGASGAVRIIWPGDQRQFPTTRTADE